MPTILVLENSPYYAGNALARLDRVLKSFTFRRDWVNYLSATGRVRRDRDVAEEAAGHIIKRKGDRRGVLMVDLSPWPQKDFYGMSVIWEFMQAVKPNCTPKGFLRDPAFLTVIVSNFRLTKRDLADRWEQKAPGKKHAAGVGIVDLIRDADLDRVLKNLPGGRRRQRKQALLPCYLKDRHDKYLWDLIKAWLRLGRSRGKRTVAKRKKP